MILISTTEQQARFTALHFQQMLSDIEQCDINCVIVKDLSRLGLILLTQVIILRIFHAHNVRFIAVTDQFLDSVFGNLHGGIMLPLKNMTQ